MVIQAVRLSKLVSHLRKQITAEQDPNQSVLAAYGKSMGLHTSRKGRSYTSELELFGYPLLDVQFSDIDSSGIQLDKTKSQHARGWIALGDRATGILFAAGRRAKGFVACGGIALGVISFGGVSVGVISFGGLALGLIAIGGGAVGYEAAGGGAIGWNSAAGGAAIAWHAAFGGLAIAMEYAVGGGAFAAEANTPAAQAVVERDSLNYLLKWMNENMTLFVMGTIAISVLPAVLMRWIYSREEPNEESK